jgi:hypothetical protein
LGKEKAMKDIKPNRERESPPSRYKLERPDNGSKSGRGFGPSSEAHKENPHKPLKLVPHGWIN